MFVRLPAASLLLLLSTSATFADEPAPERPDPTLAVARITGPLVCAHCDLGIGDECRAGIRIEEAVFLLAGKANDELLDDRLSGRICRVQGVLTVEDGNLQLFGVNDKSLLRGAQPEMIVTGRLLQDGEQLALQHGKQSIALRGQVEGLQDHVGNWIEVAGSLDVDRRGRIRLSAKAIKAVAQRPELPR